MTQTKLPMDTLWDSCGGFAKAEGVDEVISCMLTTLKPAAITDADELAQLENEIAEYDRQTEKSLDDELADQGMTLHRAAKADIITALVRYGCALRNAYTLADAITTGMIPHIEYRMEWKGNND